MFYFTDAELEALFTEHIQHIDLTTAFLRIENKAAKIQFFTTGDTTVCCTEEVMRIFSKFGIQTTLFTPSGETIDEGVKFFEGEGLCKSVQPILRAVQNLMQYASGIATRTRMLTDIIKEVSPSVILAAPRDTIPYTRKIVSKAIQSGGGALFNDGFSETIQITRNHIVFLENFENLKKRILHQKNLVPGKMILAEVKTKEDALLALDTGIDMIRLDQFQPEDIIAIRKAIDRQKSHIKIAAMGTITPQNVKEYVAAGADVLVSSWLLYGNPAGMKGIILPIFDTF